jgi:nucleoside 2-deoxyribosyltransferase
MSVRAKIYLAGPIAGLTATEANDWRKYAENVLKSYGLEGLSPLRAKVEQLPQGEALTNQGYEHHPLTSQKGIVTRDRNDVRTCDAVIFNLVGVNKLSLGSAVEFGWADAFRKPIIAILDPADTSNPFCHAFVKELSGFIVPTLDQALAVAAAIFAK